MLTRFLPPLWGLVLALNLATGCNNALRGADPHAQHPAAATSSQAGTPTPSAREGFAAELTTSPDPPQANQPAQVAFKIYGPDRRALTDYEVVHEKQFHLLLISKDLAHFAHEHPIMDPDGTWRVPITFPAPGDYRFFCDVTPTGQSQQVLRADVRVAGQAQAQPLVVDAAPKVIDGVKVELVTRRFRVGETILTFRLSRDGKPVRDLEPYLGALGHLVIVDQSLMQFLHAHPLEAGGGHDMGKMDEAANRSLAARRSGGPEVRFHTEFTSPGTYKMWGQFQRGGKVFTAPFVVKVVP
jgi:hypothetical protein